MCMHVLIYLVAELEREPSGVFLKMGIILLFATIITISMMATDR